jgi:hypothetical protein
MHRVSTCVFRRCPRYFMTKKIIAVMGATNAPGLGLVRSILGDKAGRFAVRVITLDVNTVPAMALAEIGAEVVVGHVGASVGLKAAFDGAYGAFYFRSVLNPASPQKELAEITAVARAAKDADLKHVIWATLGESKSETARAFKTLGVPATFLHAFGDPDILRRESAAEELGRFAYGIFRSGEYIGQSVPVSAELLIGAKRSTVRVPAAPVPAPRMPSQGAGVPEPGTLSIGAPTASAPLRAFAPPTASAHGALRLANRSAISGEGVAAPDLRRRLLRPWMLVPLLLAVALFGFEYLRRSPLPDVYSPTTVAASEGAEPPRPTPHPVAAIDEHDPPGPTVTSRWEQERAVATARAVKGKGIVVAPIAPPSTRPPRNVRQRRHGGTRHHDGGGDAPVSSPSESPAPRQPVVAAKEEAPVPEPVAQPAIDAPGTARPRAVERSVSRPPASASPGTIGSGAVAATVRGHAAEVRACFDRAVMERPDLHGRLAVRATVDPAGRVLSVAPTSTIEGGGRLEACVVSAFESWTFPAPAGGVKGVVSYSFSFE